MVNNILIFRTDRIGDLLYTCPAIISIKNHLKDTRITLVASNKNYDYAKGLGLFDDIFIFPQSSLIEKIKLIHKLSKINFNYVIAFDGKNRSIISSIFVKSQYKVATISEKKLSKLWSFLKIKFINDKKANIIELFQKSLNYCENNKRINNFDFLKNKLDNDFAKKIEIDNYLHIHLDEKWSSNLYIKTYTEINPKYDEIVDFFNQISQKNNILITTGLVDYELISKLRNKYFIKTSDKIYYKNNHNNTIYLINKPTFADLESLLRKSKILVSCHGAIIHAANSFNVKIIDIIEKNREHWFSRYTSHLNNYTSVYRNNFDKLKKILWDQVSNV